MSLQRIRERMGVEEKEGQKEDDMTKDGSEQFAKE